jgi:anti-sigma B factor antagonist
LVDEGWRKVVLNVAGVPYLDSAGLGEFVRAYTIVGRKGGKLKLLNPQHQLRDAFEQTKLASVFETYEGEEEALESFADPGRQADLVRRSGRSHPAGLETVIA